MKVDSTTWCSSESQAGKYLADTLEKIGDEKLVHKVSTYFHRFQNRMNALNGLEKGMRVFYLGLLMNKTKAKIKLNVRYEKVNNLMLNLITAFYRMEILKINHTKE